MMVIVVAQGYIGMAKLAEADEAISQTFTSGVFWEACRRYRPVETPCRIPLADPAGPGPCAGESRQQDPD